MFQIFAYLLIWIIKFRDRETERQEKSKDKAEVLVSDGDEEPAAKKGKKKDIYGRFWPIYFWY